jgi:NADH dehydrogenase
MSVFAHQPGRVLVTGGSGFVGRHVCEHLVRAGWKVTVPTRRAQQASAIQHLPGLTVIEADVHDEAALRRLLSGHQAVIHLVAVLHGTDATFERTHVQLVEKVTRAALASGVRRFVHVSALGADPSHPERMPSRYLRSKSRGEAVLQTAAGQGLQLTVLRPSVIFGADDRFLNLFARLQKVFPVMPLAGAKTRFQPVWVEDVARAVLQCLHEPSSVGKTYELAGPEVLTLGELVTLAGQAAGIRQGRGRPVLPLPKVLGKLQAALMELAPGEPLMSRDNLDSMKVDNIASGRLPGFAELALTPTGPRAIAPSYLDPSRDPLLALRAQSSRLL